MTEGNKAYSSMTITFLDRESGKTTKRGAICYPITRVELMAIRDGALQVIRVFDATEMDWVERPLEVSTMKPITRAEADASYAKDPSPPDVKHIDDIDDLKRMS